VASEEIYSELAWNVRELSGSTTAIAWQPRLIGARAHGGSPATPVAYAGLCWKQYAEQPGLR